MRQVTLDIETLGEFTGPLPELAELELTVVGIHDSQTNEYRAFTKETLAELWPILERTDIIIGYNSDHFDIPILNRYYPGDLGKIKSIDLLKEVKQVLNRRLKLDNLAEATLGRKKSGSGLKAQEWWVAGEVEKVKAYCLDDVRITRELYEYAKEHGTLKYRDFSAPGGSASGRDGVREIKLDTSGWEKKSNSSAMTHTLPF